MQHCAKLSVHLNSSCFKNEPERNTSSQAFNNMIIDKHSQHVCACDVIERQKCLGKLLLLCSLPGEKVYECEGVVEDFPGPTESFHPSFRLQKPADLIQLIGHQSVKTSFLCMWDMNDQSLQMQRARLAEKVNKIDASKHWLCG